MLTALIFARWFGVTMLELVHTVMLSPMSAGVFGIARTTLGRPLPSAMLSTVHLKGGVVRMSSTLLFHIRWSKRIHISGKHAFM